MAAPDITTTNPGAETLANGATYARTLVASNTPTSWSLSGGPAGIVINNSGAMSGAPVLASPTTPAVYTIVATATNGDGSDTLTWVMLVLPAVTGVASGGFRVPVNLDLASRRLSLPGLGSAQPASRPPAGSGTDTPLATWIEGENFTLSLGVEMGGLLQQIGLSRIRVLWVPAIGESPVELHVDSDVVVETGSGSTARYETDVYIDPDLVFGLVRENEGPAGARASGYLQISASLTSDADEYSFTETQTIASMTASDSDAKTFDVTLTSTEASPLAYRVTLTLNNVPGAVTCVRDLTVFYSGGTTYAISTNTGDSSDTGPVVNEGYFTTTLTVTSITATATGLEIVATATTSANEHAGKNIDLLATEGTNTDLFEIVDGEVTGVTGTLTLTLKDSGASTIGSITVANGDDAAELLAKLETATSETLVAVTFPNSTTIRVVFETGTAVDDHDFGGESSLGAPSAYPDAISLTNTSITCNVEGLPMPDLTETIKSQLTPLDIEASLDV